MEADTLPVARSKVTDVEEEGGRGTGSEKKGFFSLIWLTCSLIPYSLGSEHYIVGNSSVICSGGINKPTCVEWCPESYTSEGTSGLIQTRLWKIIEMRKERKRRGEKSKTRRVSVILLSTIKLFLEFINPFTVLPCIESTQLAVNEWRFWTLVIKFGCHTQIQECLLCLSLSDLTCYIILCATMCVVIYTAVKHLTWNL